MDATICHWTRLAARLKVTGSDAASFLQGQFSNDLRRVETHPATYGLWLNHKGRVLADSHVLQTGAETFEVISRTSPADVIRERLEAYIIADDVVVEDRTAEIESVVIAGAGAAGVLAQLGFAELERGCFVEAADSMLLPARCHRAGAWMVVCASSQMAGLRAAVAALGVREVPAAELEWHRITAGLPAVPGELGPDDLPMEAGLEHDAVSFTKGCYLGQEVMARLHNLGQVRRRLFVVQAEAGVVLAARAPLFIGDQKVGEVRAAVSGPHAGIDPVLGLAMLQVHGVQPGATLALEPGGPQMVLVDRIAEGRAP